MNKNKISALILVLSLASLTGTASAEPAGAGANQPICFRQSGAIAGGWVQPGELKVIHGPYTVRCGTTIHHFNVLAAAGQLRVRVQKMQGVGWVNVTPDKYEPSGNFGGGTFRLVLENRTSLPVSYRGTWSVPL